ncbi:MAG TPA: phosphatidylserine decarboxylase, partial [Saprospiraceae bacterium]|nr:phosphatidylserine decarboxylase [Saprospiraceae bacterium]
MFPIHREGRVTILIAILFSILIWWIFNSFLQELMWLGYALIIFVLVMVLQFFRNPRRQVPAIDEDIVIAPADGKVVVIEKVQEEEVLKCKCIQVSIFMSPLNVHVNRNPLSGIITHNIYH